MSIHSASRIVVIGGGPSGLTFARAMKSLGFSQVRVFDRSSVPLVSAFAPKPFVFLPPNSLQVYKHLGVLTELQRRGNSLVEVAMNFQNNTSPWKIPVSSIVNTSAGRFEDALPAEILSIKRSELLAVLSAGMPRDDVKYGFNAVGIGPKPPQDGRKKKEPTNPSGIKVKASIKNDRQDRVIEVADSALEVTFENGHVEDADLVVCADGIASSMRSRFFAQTQSYNRYTGDIVIRGICKVSPEEKHAVLPYPRGSLYETWGKGSRFCYAELGGNDVGWSCYFSKDRWTNLPTKDNGGPYDAPSIPAFNTVALASQFKGYQKHAVELIERTEESAVTVWPMFDIQKPSRWTQLGGRAVLLGEAAHPVVPGAGVGVALAVEGAAVLAKVLDTARARGDPLQLASSYFENTRVSRVHHLGGTAHANNEYAQQNSYFQVMLRGLASKMMGDFMMKEQFKILFDFNPLAPFTNPTFEPTPIEQK